MIRSCIASFRTPPNAGSDRPSVIDLEAQLLVNGATIVRGGAFRGLDTYIGGGQLVSLPPVISTTHGAGIVTIELQIRDGYGNQTVNYVGGRGIAALETKR